MGEEKENTVARRKMKKKNVFLITLMLIFLFMLWFLYLLYLQSVQFVISTKKKELRKLSKCKELIMVDLKKNQNSTKPLLFTYAALEGKPSRRITSLYH